MGKIEVQLQCMNVGDLSIAAKLAGRFCGAWDNNEAQFQAAQLRIIKWHNPIHFKSYWECSLATKGLFWLFNGLEDPWRAKVWPDVSGWIGMHRWAV
jgi:hypothetical protein